MDEVRAFSSPPNPHPSYETAEGPSRSPGREQAPSPMSRLGDSDGTESGSRKPEGPGLSTTLHRSPYILCMVLLYVSLATVSWTVICVLTYKPVNAKTYAFNNRGGFTDQEGYLNNERIYRSMRVVQAIVSLLTIPITSAACSYAAVAYVQHNKHSLGMTMRQTMVLADCGWTDPLTYIKLFGSVQGFRRMGSLFLLLAMALNIVGGIIQPLQQVLTSSRTIKTPGGQSQQLYTLLDIPDQWSRLDEDDNQLSILTTRDALATTRPTEPVAQLWHGNGFDCDTAELSDTAATCGYGASVSKYSMQIDSFLAELPSTFSSGMVRQFAPRFNSSSIYQPVDPGLYPQDCGNLQGSYFARYGNNRSTSRTSPWFLEVCMPADQRFSPWRNTRARQDFSEELYINVSTSVANADGSIYRLVMNTTAGYFELPNHLNGELPGPILEKDPWHYCDFHCEAQGRKLAGDQYWPAPVIYDHSDPEQSDGFYTTPKTKRSADDAVVIRRLQNKGPLLTIALALFSEGSFIHSRVSYPESIISTAQQLPNNTCTGFAPLHLFLLDSSGYTTWDDLGCLLSNATLDEAGVDLQVLTWLTTFDGKDNQAMQSAMNSAGFLANKAWMDTQVPSLAHSLTVHFDLGLETLIPAISFAGIIVISGLYLIFLISLLAMASYASFTPRWTHTLDSFTMMRLGAAMAEKLPLLVGKQQSSIRALDVTPGWIGDRDEQAEIGSLALGSKTALRRGRRYRCYDGDHEALPMPMHQSREQYMLYRVISIREDLADTRSGARHSRA